MPCFECLATLFHDPGDRFHPSDKFVCHRRIEAESLTDAVRVFGEFLGEEFRANAEMLSENMLDIFRMSRVTSDDIHKFLEILVKQTETFPSRQEPRFSSSHAPLGARNEFLVHALMSEPSGSG